MTVNLLDVIRTLPVQNHDKIGYAVSYLDLMQALQLYGIDNSEVVRHELIQLEMANRLQLFRMDGFDENLIIALRLK